ncbi:YicC family protein [Limnohabitans sp. JirII-29]|uniref:YicC/YloC family endoribonuclease n=1 Tax=Limnohabitans sp. JirII-29 TaxID=1835756 RepID=UPI000D35073B|nr:YicC/YloC family endoribonuclease [Limnohabitans sp. JirII-29]PUE26319.1 YicC family protein [Limnohabitans sp. JirII-29]
MAIYSMTGYASAQAELHPDTADTSASPALRLGLEIRSVNSRFLDLSFKMPEELRPHEAALRELVMKHLKRGKVEVRANIESSSDNTLGAPTPQLLQRLSALQDTVHSWLPKANPLSVADVLRLSTSQNTAPADIGPTLLKLAKTTLKQLSDAREREGARLSETLRERLSQLRVLAQQAAPLVPQLVEQQRLRFLERWREAMALTDGATLPEAAQDRALTEATAFAIRIDVAEELTRLVSHFEEMDALLDQGGKSEGIGKRLDFLIQELHREANTLGSKSATMEMTRISVDMKVLIEQLREQVQNLE